MPTEIICGRFAVRSCRMAAFSTATRAEVKRIFRIREKGWSTKRTARDSKSALTLKLWKPPGYWVFYNPSYLENQCTPHREVPKGLTDGSRKYDCLRTSIKRLQSTPSVICPPRLPGVKNVLLNLVNYRALSTQASLTEPHGLAPLENDGDIDHLEIYDSKEGSRQFQKQRYAYRSLCYHKDECCQPISIEECNLILQEAAVLKDRLKPRAIADSFFRLSSLEPDKHKSIKSNSRFAMLCQYAVKNIQLFENSELIMILKAFVSLGISSTQTMLKVYETECCRRVGNMSLDQQLLVADLWRYLGYRVPRYLDTMLSNTNMNWNHLSLPQLVQLIYIIGEGRKAPKELIKKLDVSVVKHLAALSLEEIGVICLGIFKSNNSLSEPTMRKIGDKVAAHMGDMSSSSLVNVLKMFRSTHIDHIDLLKQLGQVIPSRIPSISIQGVMHIAFACSSLHYCDKKILDAVAASVPSKATYCRTKDIGKLLWTFGNLNYEPPNAEEFYAVLEEQMRSRMFECNKFPEHLITSLLGLAFAKRFPQDLIDYALSPEFLQLISKSKFDLGNDLFTLDGTVEIECPSYTGSRLTTQWKQEVAAKIWNHAVTTISLKQEITVAWSLLEYILGGSPYVKLHMVLPHTRSVDLEIHLDSNQKPLPFNSESVRTGHLELKKSGLYLTDNIISQLLKGKSAGQPFPEDVTSEKGLSIQQSTELQKQSIRNHLEFSDGLLRTDTDWNTLVKPKASSKVPLSPEKQQQPRNVKLALQITNRNQYSYDSKHLLGLHNMKRRQLCQIGYIPVELPFWEWFPLLKCNRSEKLSYLYHKVFGREQKHHREPDI